MLMTLTTTERVSSEFASMLDQTTYESLPDGWLIGMTDIINSTHAIGHGRYRDVNFAGVAIIAALGNALGTFDFPFTFGGDGAAFAVPITARDMAETALRQVKAYAQQEFGLTLRIGVFPISEIRVNGLDVRIALYAASRNVTYTMFSGGGIRWAEKQLKLGRLQPPGVTREADPPPDLSGLSCEWAPFANRNGTILSLLVAPQEEESDAFTTLVRRVVKVLDRGHRGSIPVPEHLPSADGGSKKMCPDLWSTVLSNSDFRKYDDTLRLTADCTLEQVEILKTMLSSAEERGDAVYGLHCQSHAIMTCFVPSSSPNAHRHFLDGMDGGYAMASAMMRKARINPIARRSELVELHQLHSRSPTERRA